MASLVIEDYFEMYALVAAKDGQMSILTYFSCVFT
jgi:hypothetical protein